MRAAPSAAADRRGAAKRGQFSKARALLCAALFVVAVVISGVVTINTNNIATADVGGVLAVDVGGFALSRVCVHLTTPPFGRYNTSLQPTTTTMTTTTSMLHSPSAYQSSVAAASSSSFSDSAFSLALRPSAALASPPRPSSASAPLLSCAVSSAFATSCSLLTTVASVLLSVAGVALVCVLPPPAFATVASDAPLGARDFDVRTTRLLPSTTARTTRLLPSTTALTIRAFAESLISRLATDDHIVNGVVTTGSPGVGTKATLL
jgi:hypothetical protein